MAIGTRVPHIVVLAAVNGEILAIVVKLGRHPTGVRGMALGTIGREICSLVVRVIGIVVIGSVAFKAIGRGVAEIAVFVALIAVLDIVSQG